MHPLWVSGDAKPAWRLATASADPLRPATQYARIRAPSNGGDMARVVFFGTPQFAVPVLEALLQHHEVAAVVTQPDRHAGRGRRRVRMSPAKHVAEANTILVLQPSRLRHDRSVADVLREAIADLFVVAAYGQILPDELLGMPHYGCLGVHASLLPQLRGASPIAAAILEGHRETGITLMLTDAGMDTGPIIAQRSLAIAPDDTTESLSEKLAHLGAALLIETVPSWIAGKLTARSQNDALATYAPRLSKSQGAIDWRRTAGEIDRQVRALTPWPGTYCACGEDGFKILSAHPLPQWQDDAPPGTVVNVGECIGVATGEGLLLLDRVQLAGKKAMDACEFARGREGFVAGTLK